MHTLIKMFNIIEAQSATHVAVHITHR